MKIYESFSENDTREIAKELSKQLKEGDVIALAGELGAGKTAFVKGLHSALDCDGEVTSPTFTLVNQYDGEKTLYHFDVYRLENISIDDCDWIDDYIFGDGICIIEWADNIKDILPDEHIRIEIKKDYSKGESYREIKIC